jgi:hypothetical protein
MNVSVVSSSRQIRQEKSAGWYQKLQPGFEPGVWYECGFNCIKKYFVDNNFGLFCITVIRRVLLVVQEGRDLYLGSGKVSLKKSRTRAIKIERKVYVLGTSCSPAQSILAQSDKLMITIRIRSCAPRITHPYALPLSYRGRYKSGPISGFDDNGTDEFFPDHRQDL